MTAAVLSTDTGFTAPVSAAAQGASSPISRRLTRLAWWAIGLLLAGLAVTHLGTIATVASTALQAVLAASTWWLVVALACSVASMVAFAELRRRTLRPAGGVLPLGAATSLTYAANAVQFAPGGSVVSTGYLVRKMRDRGLTPAMITWSVTLTQVISGGCLAALAATGLALTGGGSLSSFLPGLLGGLVLTVLVLWMVRCPAQADRLAESSVIGVNRLLRRSPDRGLDALRTVVADLRQVRPRIRDWVLAGVAAMLNWLLALVCLWACAHALGIAVSPLALLVSFTLAMAGTGFSLLPAGLGVVDGILLVGLTAAGATASAALGAVVLYRVVSMGSVLIGGWAGVHVRSGR